MLLPQLLLVLGAFVVFGADLIWRDRNWLPYLALLGLAVALGATLYLLLGVDLPGEPILGGMLAVDSFALFFQIVAVLTGGLVILSAVDYMQERTPYRAEFYSLLLIACLAITLVAAGTDLVMIYIAIELLSITSYILTGYLREDRKSTEAAIKYFLYGAMASAAMLYGMSLLYGVTGATSLGAIAASLGDADASLRWLVFPALVFVLAGFGFKIAAVPFHQWSPDAYEGAPTPITAFLSVGSKAAGFAVLVRVLITALPDFRLDWVAVLSAISMATMTVGTW